MLGSLTSLLDTVMQLSAFREGSLCESPELQELERDSDLSLRIPAESLTRASSCIDLSALDRD